MAILNPEADYDIPDETQRVARAAFPNGNPYMRLRDELGHLYEDEAFAPLFSSTGQLGLAPWRLAWVTVLQFAEGLTDRQAADVVRARIDWKYVLGLPLEDAGFNYSVLSEFRARLASRGSEAILLERVLERARERQWLKAGGRQRTDSTHVLAAIHQLNRLELVGQTLQHALNAVARQAPEWLQRVAPVVWWDRYAKKLDDYRLPKKESGRRSLAEVIGQDGWHLSALINHRETPPDLIIQVELHLISDPLGTLVGLHETEVDALCTWDLDGHPVRPKVIASTATIRLAQSQIHSLFLRQVRIFPPAALDAQDNFFSRRRAGAESYTARRDHCILTITCLGGGIMAELGALGALAAGLWLLGILPFDFGPIVIFLFVAVIGNFILAIMTLIDIKRT